jgi:hypothetical protein
MREQQRREVLGLEMSSEELVESILRGLDEHRSPDQRMMAYSSEITNMLGFWMILA